MSTRRKPPYPPKPDMSPDAIPHYPEWPYAPHADWPHGSWGRPNDTEPGHVVPWPVDCERHYEDQCLCVTSADMSLWNSYSGLSGLTAFDASAISALFDKVSDMDDYDNLRDGYDTVSAYSGIWSSAAYVPDIYQHLSALASGQTDKLDYSAAAAFLDLYEHTGGEMGDGSLKVWTDSLKDYYFGDRVPHDMTIVGDGTLDRPLRVGKDIVNAAMLVYEVTNGFQTSANLLQGTQFKKSTIKKIISDSRKEPDIFFYC